MASTTDTTTVRDDLFTHIHKALRLALFDMAISIGRTDWGDPQEVVSLESSWRPLLELLRSHTAHEDHYIFRLLDSHDPMAVDPAGDQHRDLDDLLDDVAARFDELVARPDAAGGVALYRDFNRFVAAYLPHLHDEETSVMRRIWECCSDEEIAGARAAFMADTPPEVMATSLRYLLPAIDTPTRLQLAAGLAGSPPPVIDMVNGIAEQVLTAAQADRVRSVLTKE